MCLNAIIFSPIGGKHQERVFKFAELSCEGFVRSEETFIFALPLRKGGKRRSNEKDISTLKA